jgi:hypothetical protein
VRAIDAVTRPGSSPLELPKTVVRFLILEQLKGETHLFDLSVSGVDTLLGAAQPDQRADSRSRRPVGGVDAAANRPRHSQVELNAREISNQRVSKQQIGNQQIRNRQYAIGNQ